MDVARHILMLLEKHPLITHQWHMMNVRPLPKNSGIRFRVHANLFDGLVKIWYNSFNSTYIITFIPFDLMGVVTELKHVEEKDLVAMLSKHIGQSTFSTDYMIDILKRFNVLISVNVIKKSKKLGVIKKSR